MIPGYLAPVTVGWSSTNSSPLIRLTSIGSDGARVVLRSPDGASNPYLVIAACLAAGLSGIKEGLEPPVCMDDLSEKEAKKNAKLFQGHFMKQSNSLKKMISCRRLSVRIFLSI